MAKKVLLGVATVAVVAIGYFIYAGSPRTGGAEGTIEAAKRHHTTQIQSDDVILKDPEVQALLQSDFFDRVIHDKSFQQMVTDGTLDKVDSQSLVLMSRALGNAQFKDALGRQDYKAAQTVVEQNSNLVGLSNLDRAALQAALYKAEYLEALRANNIEQAVAILDRETVAASTIDALAFQAYMATALNQAQFKDAVAKGDVAKAQQVLGKVSVERISLEKANVDAALSSALERESFQQALLKGDLAAAHQELAKSGLDKKTLDQNVVNVYMASLLSMATFRDALNSKNVVTAQSALAQNDLCRVGINKAMWDERIMATFDKSSFKQAVANKDVVSAASIVEKSTVNFNNTFDRNMAKTLLSTALAKENFSNALSKEDVSNASVIMEKAGVALQDLERQNLSNALKSASMHDVLAKMNAEQLSTLARGDFRETISANGFSTLLQSARFRQAMKSGDTVSFKANM